MCVEKAALALLLWSDKAPLNGDQAWRPAYKARQAVLRKSQRLTEAGFL